MPRDETRLGGERGAVARANVRGGEVRAREGKDAEGGERDDAPRVAGAQHGESRCGVEVVEERAIGVVVARESARTPIAISFARVPVAAGEGESRRRGLVRARGSEGVRGGRLLPVDAGDRRVVGTGDVEHLAVLDVKQLHGAVRVAGHEHLTVRSPTQARHGTVGVGRPQLVLALGGGLVPVQPSQGKLPVRRRQRQEIHRRAPRGRARGSQHVLVVEKRERVRRGGAGRAGVGSHRSRNRGGRRRSVRAPRESGRVGGRGDEVVDGGRSTEILRHKQPRTQPIRTDFARFENRRCESDESSSIRAMRVGSIDSLCESPRGSIGV